MRFGRIEKLLDERVPFERLLDDPALNAFTSPVNQTDLAQRALMRGSDVLLDDGADVSGRERVQIKRAFDRDSHRTR